MSLKLRSHGRGGNYSPWRGIVESTLSLLYAGGWPARLWGAVPGACDVRVVRRTLPLLPPGTPPLRIGFVSDIHFGPTTPRRLIDTAFFALSAEPLDALFLGGDYVFLDATTETARALGECIDRVSAVAKFAVLGNHDLWSHHELLEAEFANRGVDVLINRAITLPPPHSAVTIVGLDDPWTGADDADTAFAQIGDGQTVVVLCHAPEALPLIRGRQVPLMMCGHTHGGQVAGPRGPLVVPGHHGRRHPAGFYDIDGTTLFVSRGVGGVEVPVRTFAPPDVAVITLTSEESR